MIFWSLVEVNWRKIRKNNQFSLFLSRLCLPSTRFSAHNHRLGLFHYFHIPESLKNIFECKVSFMSGWLEERSRLLKYNRESLHKNLILFNLTLSAIANTCGGIVPRLLPSYAFIVEPEQRFLISLYGLTATRMLATQVQILSLAYLIRNSMRTTHQE